MKIFRLLAINDLINRNTILDNPLYTHQTLYVDEKQTLLRIDKFLLDRLPNTTRNKVQEGIKRGYIMVNGEVVKQNYKVKPGDVITLALPTPPRDTTVIKEEIALDIVYEDEYVLIVNKPSGMVVHPAHNNWSGTLVNALAWRFDQLPEMANNEGRPGLVHRIDKDTSGLLVIAKQAEAMTHLAKQFFDHDIDRKYLALIWGEPKEDEGTIDVHLGRSLKDRRVTAPFEDASFGRRAITHYKVIKKLRYVSLIECNLETGRTHQIRAHMKHIGHPIFGDATYGGDKICFGSVFTKYKQFVNNCFKILSRQALHAQSLGFIHPHTNEKVYFSSNLPDDFREVLTKWEKYVTYE